MRSPNIRSTPQLSQASAGRIDEYVDIIRAVGALSNLFSESSKPYIDYRLSERMFCRCFGADDISRSDASVDARLGTYGIGIKTFLETGERRASLQKIAEFNRESVNYRDLEIEEAVDYISRLRNERISFTKRTYGVEETAYHCLVRGEGLVYVVECPLELIRTDSIKIEKGRKDKTTVFFSDGLNDYSFNRSKSTLYKRFDCSDSLLDIGISILDDPFEVLKDVFSRFKTAMPAAPSRPALRLALYSVRRGEKYVPERSGLNQWNARGRKRDFDEVYIPVPKEAHRASPNFFPPRDTKFGLRLPDGKTILNAKICQDGEKALMTDPNSALGEWILRDVLDIAEGELVTYERLQEVGINSVVVYKNGESDYSIDFVYQDNGDEGDL